MDPWTPQTQSSTFTDQLGIVFPQGSGSLGPHDLSSDRYLWSIEAKLKRVKGSGREPLAKDIIKGLSELRHGQPASSSVTSSDSSVRDSDLPYISDAEYIEDYDRSSVTYMLQRRIAPERRAVNPVELKVLLENDELAKTMNVEGGDSDVLCGGDVVPGEEAKVDDCAMIAEEPVAR